MNCNRIILIIIYTNYLIAQSALTVFSAVAAWWRWTIVEVASEEAPLGSARWASTATWSLTLAALQTLGILIVDTGLGAAVTAAQAASRLTQIIVVVAPGATGSSTRRSSGATSRSSGRSTGWSSAEVLSWLTRAGLHLLLRLPVNDWCRLLLLLLGRRFGVFAFHFAILAAILLHPGTEVTALVRCKLTAPHRLTGGTGHVGRLVALLTNDHVELNDLTVAHRADRLFGVVPRNGALVHKDILSGVVAVDEAVAALHVEPLDGAGDFGGCNGKE